MGLFSDIMESVFGDAGMEEPTDLFHDQAAVADLLPYRLYNPENQLFYNEKTTGFIVEIPPLVSTEEAVGNLHSALVSNMPTSAGFQVVSWTSPDISKNLGGWARSRVMGGEVGEAIAVGRLAHIQSKRFGSDSDIKAIPTNRRLFVCGWVEGETSMSKIRELEEYRRGVLGAFNQSKNTGMKPSELILLLQEILHSESFDNHGLSNYTTEIPLNAQIPGTTIIVKPNHIEFGGDPKVSMVAASVARFPEEWNDMLGVMLMGDPDKISDRPHGPVLTSLTCVAIPAQKASGDMVKRIAKMEHGKKTGFNKFIPEFGKKEAEIQGLNNELEQGERLFQCTMTVMAYTEGDREEARMAGSEIAKIYRRVGFALRKEKYLQLPMLINALPLGCTEKAMKEMGKLQRMRLLKAKAVSALAPLHGEWTGNSNGPGMLLLGRQGQAFTWSNYISEGNYNVAVVGKSGAGKSVFMQELITSIYYNGGRALIIDDGFSFKTTCEIVGGRHIVFESGNILGLNPFSMLQAEKMKTTEYASEAIELITRVISSMAVLGEQREGRVGSVEEGAIATAIKKVWEEKQSDGEIVDVYNILLKLTEGDKGDKRYVDVCSKIADYIPGGKHGKYFVGPATVNVDTPFTVVELSNLKAQPELEQVVLQIVMFLGTELMYKTDRSVPVAILIDEAWDMLKGEGTAKFIEGVVRRARKYTGALITGTQSIDDYYANPAAEVCLQNSDWTVFLAQKPETIDRLEANKRLSIPMGFGTRLKSLTSVPGQFSEMAIKGADGWAFGRLLLDPFSLAVFSSKGSTVENLNRRKAAGMSTVEALKDMVAKGDVS